MTSGHRRKFLALCGGVGGAKLALGLSRHLSPDELTIVVNTGDDFEHLGLPISPDLDTVLYTLAGLSNQTLGWGRGDESWTAFKEMQLLGGAGWFQLGDKDIGLHLARRHLLESGHTLSEVMQILAHKLGVSSQIVPMTDDVVRTMVETDEGRLAFQHYFVARQCQPMVRSIEFQGVDSARPAPGFLAALSDPELSGVIICPSNPFLSIDPILAIPGIRSLLSQISAPVIAVTPLIANKAVKGPTAKIFTELQIDPTPSNVASHYAGFLNGFVLDQTDASQRADFDPALEISVEQTLMQTDQDKISLAEAVVAFAERLGRRGASSS